MCRTWSELYASVDSFWEEVLREKSLLKQEVQKLSGQEEQRVKKISGELDVSCQKLKEVQDEFSQRGMTIAGPEKQLLALFLQFSKVTKLHEDWGRSEGHLERLERGVAGGGQMEGRFGDNAFHGGK